MFDFQHGGMILEKYLGFFTKA